MESEGVHVMVPPRLPRGRRGALAGLMVTAGVSAVVAGGGSFDSTSVHAPSAPAQAPDIPTPDAARSVPPAVAGDSASVADSFSALEAAASSDSAAVAVPSAVSARLDWLPSSLASFDLPPAGARHMLIAPREQLLPMWGQVTALYAGQWAYYLLSQTDALGQEGSFRNWYSNPASPHFDKDFYDFNLVRHTMAGSLYYGYYRAFGDTRQRSLALSTVSVLLFEFTIEVATERPSWQDIYQTPVLGALLGMGLEDLSLACLRSPWKPVRALGYVFNPYVLVPGSAWRLGPDPEAAVRGRTGGRLVGNF